MHAELSRSKLNNTLAKENNKIVGRHIISVRNAMMSELTLRIYSLESVVFHLLNRRIPKYSWKTLSDWFTSTHGCEDANEFVPALITRVFKYYVTKARLNLEILEKQEFISRTRLGLQS